MKDLADLGDDALVDAHRLMASTDPVNERFRI